MQKKVKKSKTNKKHLFRNPIIAMIIEISSSSSVLHSFRQTNKQIKLSSENNNNNKNTFDARFLFQSINVCIHQ